MSAPFTIKRLDEAPDVTGDYPGEMRFLAPVLGTEQVALTHRRMPAGTGGKGSYGHFHHTQEEVYFVLDGTAQFKLGDEVVDVTGPAAVRVAAATPRSVWNDGPDDVNLVIVSTRVADLGADVEKVPDFWPQ